MAVLIDDKAINDRSGDREITSCPWTGRARPSGKDIVACQRPRLLAGCAVPACCERQGRCRRSPEDLRTGPKVKPHLVALSAPAVVTRKETHTLASSLQDFFIDRPIFAAVLFTDL